MQRNGKSGRVGCQGLLFAVILMVERISLANVLQAGGFKKVQNVLMAKSKLTILGLKNS